MINRVAAVGAMYRALIWKEWKQAWVLTAVGACLGLLTPLVLLLAGSEEISLTGWRAYQAMGVFDTLCPWIFAFGLWPLWALLISVQVFSADRAAATERFLLDRPVPRTRIWSARWLAATSSLLTVVAASMLGCWLFGWVMMRLWFSEWLETMSRTLMYNHKLLILGLALGLVGTAGAFVATCGGKSFGAVLLGGVVALGVGAWLSRSALLYFVVGEQILIAGLSVADVILLVGSWLVFTRGEPAGRGRWLRGGIFLLVGSAAMVALVLVGSPVILERALRPLGSYGGPSFHVGFPHHGRESFFIPARRGMAGWLIDAVTGRRLRVLPGAWNAAYSPDGDRVAVAMGSGPLGLGDGGGITLFDARNGARLETIPLDPEGVLTSDLFWRGERLLFTRRELERWGRGAGKLLEVDPANGRIRQIVSLSRSVDGVVHSYDGKRVYLVTRGEGTKEHHFAPIDVERGVVGESIVIDGDEGNAWLGALSLSRDGKYWLSRKGEGVVEVIDLASGESVFRFESIARLDSHCWLADATVAWISPVGAGAADDEMALHLWDPRQGARRVPGEIPPVVDVLRGSPSGKSLLLLGRGARRGRQSGVRVYTMPSGAWRSLPVEREGQSPWWAGWVGSATLALGYEDGVFLLDLDGGELRWPI